MIYGNSSRKSKSFFTRTPQKAGVGISGESPTAACGRNIGPFLHRRQQPGHTPLLSSFCPTRVGCPFEAVRSSMMCKPANRVGGSRRHKTRVCILRRRSFFHVLRVNAPAADDGIFPACRLQILNGILHFQRRFHQYFSGVQSIRRCCCAP